MKRLFDIIASNTHGFVVLIDSKFNALYSE